MTKPQFEIIKFESNEYTPIAAVHNLVYPDFPLTTSEFAQEDADRDAHCGCERWLALVGTQVAAYGGFGQSPETYKAGEYRLMGGVMPEFRRRGIGSTLFDTVADRLRKLDVRLLKSYSREDCEGTIHFLTSRGFVETFRDCDWELDVTSFDPTQFSDVVQKLAAEGITIRSLLQLEDDPNRNRKLYDLENELIKDTPGAEENLKLPFDKWVAQNIGRREYPAEGYLVAIEYGDYIGQTHFRIGEADNTLYTTLTGVVRSHRRRGVALALKVASINWAKRAGYRRIWTGNKSNNDPILNLNDRLGFSRLPAWVYYEKRFDTD